MAESKAHSEWLRKNRAFRKWHNELIWAIVPYSFKNIYTLIARLWMYLENYTQPYFVITRRLVVFNNDGYSLGKKSFLVPIEST